MDAYEVAVHVVLLAVGVLVVATADKQARAARGRSLGPVPLTRRFYVGLGLAWIALAVVSMLRRASPSRGDRA